MTSTSITWVKIMMDKFQNFIPSALLQKNPVAFNLTRDLLEKLKKSNFLENGVFGYFFHFLFFFNKFFSFSNFAEFL